MANPRKVFEKAAKIVLDKLATIKTEEARDHEAHFKDAITAEENARSAQAARAARMSRVNDMLDAMKPLEQFFWAEGLRMIRESRHTANPGENCSLRRFLDELGKAKDHGNAAREVAKIVDCFDDIRCAHRELEIDVENAELWKARLAERTRAAHAAAAVAGIDFDELCRKIEREMEEEDPE